MPPAPRDRGTSAASDTRPDPGGLQSAIATAFDSEEACVRFLDRKTPEELVEIFSGSDPLRIVERCGRFVWDEGLFLDVDRLVEHAMYHIAFRTSRRPREASIDDWLRECISHSALSLLRKDVEMVKDAGDREVEAWACPHEFIRDALGIGEVEALRACSAFNGMTRRERQAFFALCMDKRTVDECLEAGFGPPEWLREICIRGLDRLLGIAPHPVLTPCDDDEEGESDER